VFYGQPSAMHQALKLHGSYNLLSKYVSSHFAALIPKADSMYTVAVKLVFFLSDQLYWLKF